MIINVVRSCHINIERNGEIDTIYIYIYIWLTLIIIKP